MAVEKYIGIDYAVIIFMLLKQQPHKPKNYLATNELIKQLSGVIRGARLGVLGFCQESYRRLPVPHLKSPQEPVREPHCLLEQSDTEAQREVHKLKGHNKKQTELFYQLLHHILNFKSKSL